MCFKIFCLLVLSLNIAQTAAAAAFRAAVAKVDITPATSQWLLGYDARQSDGIHDRLYHRIVALDDGKTTIFIVSSDIALMSPAYNDKVAQDVQQKLGIPSQNLWWTVTHTHSAPEVGPPGVPAIFMPGRYKQANGVDSNPEYTQFFEDKLIEGLRLAKDGLEPARLGVGLGFSTANINRRGTDVDGKVLLGLNPDGPVDRQIGLIRLENIHGGLIALIANYAMHGTVLGSENLKISGDAPGVVADYVEQKIGAPMLFINGAEGNMGEFRRLLGDRILQANERVAGMTTDVVLTESETTVETPLRPGLTWPSELGKYIRTLPDGTKLVRIPIRFLQVNRDTVLWGAPVELFCEFAIDVRDHSRFPYTFYFGLLDGWLGYLPNRQAFREGGYEPSTSPFTEQVDDNFRQGVINHISGLAR
jgi:neutral ceramidase